MRDFFLHQPTRVYFGKRQQAPFFDSIALFGKRFLILIGGGSVVRHGYLDLVTTSLAERNLEYVIERGIEPNPEANTINAIAARTRHSRIDAVIALGGGSVMDAAKAIGALLFMNEHDIWPFTLGNPRHGSITGSLPILAIPTTAATASEVTPNAVISHAEAQGKAPVSHASFKPVASWLQPEFTMSVSAETTRDGAADIISHVIENYILGWSESSLTDRYCEGIIDTVLNALPACLQDVQSYEPRAQLLWASNLALNGYHAAGRSPSVFVLHAMEHALSGVRSSLAHGRGLATLFPAYFSWMIEHNRCVDRFARLGERLFLCSGSDFEKATGFVHHFTHWLRENGLLQSLHDLGFTAADKAKAAAYAIQTYGSGGQMNVAGPFTVHDILDIFTRTEAQALPKS